VAAIRFKGHQTGTCVNSNDVVDLASVSYQVIAHIHKSALGLVAFEVAKFDAISYVYLWLLNNDSITVDRVSHVS